MITDCIYVHETNNSITTNIGQYNYTYQTKKVQTHPTK